MYLLLTVIHTDMMSVVIETGTKIADSVLKLYMFSESSHLFVFLIRLKRIRKNRHLLLTHVCPVELRLQRGDGKW